jgi:putative glutamine amidotransferase
MRRAPRDRVTVGVTASTGDITAGAWTDPSAYSPLSYVRAVQRAGARAVLLVPDAEDAADPASVFELVDAVVLSGGAGDVDPARYGQSAHPETTPDDPLRDAFELAIVAHAQEAGAPLLGICRGMQVVNVALGGVLEQHLPDALGHDAHRLLPAGFAEHAVRLEPGTLAARAAGGERETVLSHHHQGVRTVGDGLRATGWADRDGTVEAVEGRDGRFLLGVLWHPEEDERSRVVAALVDAAEERR